MIEQLIALIVDESKWLTASLSCALAAVAVLLARYRRSGLPARRLTLAAMNLFFGVTVGAMAVGHLLAVTTKLASGTLEGPAPGFYVIGTALAVPSWWLAHHTRAVLASDDGRKRVTLVLNAWLAITLLALGLHNLPLAAPGFLNIGYAVHSGRFVGRALAGLAIVLGVALFIGSLVFLFSGQSFEQFRGV